MNIIDIEINPPFIKLEQFLKFTNMCESGGHAKLLIQNGEVTVNSEICEMRGKKLYNNDIVAFIDEDEAFRVHINDN